MSTIASRRAKAFQTLIDERDKYKEQRDGLVLFIKDIWDDYVKTGKVSREAIAFAIKKGEQ